MRYFAVIFLTLACAAANAQTKSVDLIKQEIIRDSINSYSGRCACPYSTTRTGSRCVGNSAYSRSGGKAPLCYPEDVTSEMVEKYSKTR